jgi:hypothetical protein
VQAGRHCSELGRRREAKAWFGLAARLDPKNKEARAALAREAKSLEDLKKDEPTL